jgi:cysteine desulfurase / selenocysteine lyase
VSTEPEVRSGAVGQADGADASLGPADGAPAAPHRSAPYDVAALRETEFPWTADTLYLNNASVGPMPERTRRALDAFNHRRTQPHLLPDRDLFATLAESRRLAARLLNAAPEEIALAGNTSFGINVAARVLPLEPGDIVLASEREFPANVYPWQQLGARGVTLELARTTPEGWPDEAYLLERIQDPRVRVLAVSLVQFSTGYQVDLERLSAAARASDTFLVVDAIQGLGHHPVDVRRTPVDILSCGAQKWLLSPWGSGFFYVRRELIESLTPEMIGWMAFEGTEDFTRLTKYDATFRRDARRFELVTLPYQDFAGMNASLDLLLAVGIDQIRRHIELVHAPVVEWAERRGVRLASPRGRNASAILCVAPPRVEECFLALRGAGVVCTMREGAIRLSPHLYNTVDELARAVDILDRSL